jgi:uncharacterized membrane protein YhaH (DUF805 family)
MNFESLFANPLGRTPRNHFVPALLTLLAAVVFFWYFVNNRTGTWSQLVLMYPASVLHASRLRDMGISVWLLVIPLALMLGAFLVWLDFASFGTAVDRALPPAALMVAAAFAVWCCVGRSR